MPASDARRSPARRGPDADARRVRPDRRHADRGAGRARRGDRLVLPAALRQRQRLRRPARPGARAAPGPSARRASGPPPSATSRAPTSSRPPSGPPDGVVRPHRLHAGGRGRPAVGPAPRDPPAAALHPRPGADADGLHAALRVRRAHHPARAAPGRPLRHRPDRPGPHPLERQAVRLDRRAVHRHHPVRRWRRARSAGWSCGTTTTTSIRWTATRAPASSTSPPRSGQRWAAERALQRPVPRHGQALGAGAQAAHPRRDRAPSSPRRRPRCPRRSAACATGTIASCGSGTRRSRSRRSTPSATAARPTRSCASSRRSAATRAAATCRSCTASTAAATWSSASSTT